MGQQRAAAWALRSNPADQTDVPAARWGLAGVETMIGYVWLLSALNRTTNYYLMAGNTVPFLSPSTPYKEGLSIDGTLTLVAVVLLAVHLVAVRARPDGSATGRRAP
jgi:hypothetical protein